MPTNTDQQRQPAVRLRTLDQLQVRGQRVLVRCDLNVPLTRAAGGASAEIADDARIRAALPTLRELLRDGAAIILVSHLGRPKGYDQSLSLRPVAQRLGQLLAVPVQLAPGVVGADVDACAQALTPGRILLLENVRFEAGETANDPTFAAALAALADVYVDDAFGCAHRAHASTEGVARLLPSAAGRLLEREVLALCATVDDPARPLVAVFGGAKVGDKLGLLARFMQVADVVCVGGAMAFPLLVAEGHRVGASPCAAADLERAVELLGEHADCRLELPTDLVIAATGLEPDRTAVVGDDLGDGEVAGDIGPRTRQRFTAAIATAATVLWNGPMGRFESPPFAEGTAAVARAVTNTHAVTVVGGGETIEALREFGDPARVTHVSTGGGAMLEFLEGRSLPGVQALLVSAAP